MMDNHFANDFVTKLDGKVDAETLKTVLAELQLFSANYDITAKETAVVPYEGDMPYCFKAYLVAKKIEGMSPETMKTYICYIRDFLKYIGKPLKEVETNDVRVYIYQMQIRTGCSNRTLDGKRLVLHTFLDWCKNEGYIDSNPVAQIKPIKYEATPREPLTDIELELVRDACATPRERAIIETLYSTGCRVTELVRLNKRDIDFQTKEVHLFGKGSKHRISYINAKAEVALKKYYAVRKGDCESVFVHTNRPYVGLKKTGIEKIVHDIGVRAEIGRPLYPHLLRHTTATDALSHGMNVAEVQKLLGHEKLDTTMIYAKICQDEVKYAHRKSIV